MSTLAEEADAALISLRHLESEKNERKSLPGMELAGYPSRASGLTADRELRFAFRDFCEKIQNYDNACFAIDAWEDIRATAGINMSEARIAHYYDTYFNPGSAPLTLNVSGVLETRAITLFAPTGASLQLRKARLGYVLVMIAEDMTDGVGRTMEKRVANRLVAWVVLAWH